MHISEPLIILAACSFIAYIVRGATGAASAIIFNATLIVVLIVYPRGAGLLLIDGIYHLALLELFASILLAIIVRKRLLFDRLIALILVGLIPTTIIFSLILVSLDASAIQLPLSITMLFVGVTFSSTRRERVLKTRHSLLLAIPAGVAAGILGGLFGMGGPVLLLFVAHITPNPTDFRDRFVTIGLVFAMVRFSVLVTSGIYGAQRLGWMAASLPFVALGLAVGARAHNRLTAAGLRIGLGAVVTIAGLLGLLAALRLSPV